MAFDDEPCYIIDIADFDCRLVAMPRDDDAAAFTVSRRRHTHKAPFYPAETMNARHLPAAFDEHD